jgi:hypothetical protein
VGIRNLYFTLYMHASTTYISTTGVFLFMGEWVDRDRSEPMTKMIFAKMNNVVIYMHSIVHELSDVYI